MMAGQSAPRQQASRDGLHEPKAGNRRDISTPFQKRQQRVNLKIQCRHERGKTPGYTPGNRRSRMLVRGKEVKANGDESRGQKYRSHRIPTDRFLDYRSEPGVGDWVPGNLVVRRDGEPGSFVTCICRITNEKPSSKIICMATRLPNV